MSSPRLNAQAKALVARDKGLLAMDESNDSETQYGPAWPRRKNTNNN